MKKVKIISTTSEFNWWYDCVGQICPVIDIAESTGFLRIQVMKTEPGFDPYPVEGWIRDDCVEFVEQ